MPSLGTGTENVTFYLGALHTLWLLLPLIPAILIFRLFRDSVATITGPVLGFTISAGGAFAGYLIIVVLTMSWTNEAQRIVASSVPPPHWEVTAEIKLFDSNERPISDSDLVSKIRVFTSNPEWYKIDPYTFIATINVVEVKGSLPRIVIVTPGYGNQMIESATLLAGKTDTVYKLIKLKKPIEFHKERSTTPSQPAPGDLPSPAQ